jgi:hypothetical protein
MQLIDHGMAQGVIGKAPHDFFLVSIAFWAVGFLTSLSHREKLN